MPRGLKYKIEIAHPGIIVPGTDDEPVATIVLDGCIFHYRLISYKLQAAGQPTMEGDYPYKTQKDVEGWAWDNLTMLLAEAHLHHIIRFDKKSKCYYDFLSQTLYGANGYYEKKGSVADGRVNVAAIRGEPIMLPDSVIPFIERLTKHPKTGVEIDRFIDENFDEGADDNSWGNTLENERKKISQAFYKFKQYDTSIGDTFFREKTGRRLFKYMGEPQIWFIGEDVPFESLTIDKVYKAVAKYDVITICDPVTGQLLHSVLSSDISAEESMAFLGLDAELLDPSMINVKTFFDANFCDSADVLKSMLSNFCTILDTVWARIAKNIKNNFLRSLSASTFYADTRVIPQRQSDLKAYPVNEERLWIVLNQTYTTAVTGVIKSTGIAEEFFRGCKLEIAPKNPSQGIEKAIDGIVALILLCFCCCQTSFVDEELSLLTKRYQSELRERIHEKFDYIPPGGSGGSLFDPEALQIGLQDLLSLGEQLSSEGLYEYASRTLEIWKIFTDGFNLNYNDENSLFSPSMGREL